MVCSDGRHLSHLQFLQQLLGQGLSSRQELADDFADAQDGFTDVAVRILPSTLKQ